MSYLSFGNKVGRFQLSSGAEGHESERLPDCDRDHVLLIDGKQRYSDGEREGGGVA